MDGLSRLMERRSPPTIHSVNKLGRGARGHASCWRRMGRERALRNRLNGLMKGMNLSTVVHGVNSLGRVPCGHASGWRREDWERVLRDVNRLISQGIRRWVSAVVESAEILLVIVWWIVKRASSAWARTIRKWV